MNYLIDSANLDVIRHGNEFYPIAGVTTNPTLVAKEKVDFRELLTSIRSIIGLEKMMHVQTTAKTTEGIIEEAKLLKEMVGGVFYVKIPIGEQGLKAIPLLKKQGIDVTMTAIFTPQQALLAAKAGAVFVAPYVNRFDNICSDGCETVANIVQLFEMHNIDCQVLAASFKNVQQLNMVALSGAHNATVDIELLKAAVSHPMTDDAISRFDRDWRSVYGEKGVLELLKTY